MIVQTASRDAAGSIKIDMALIADAGKTYAHIQQLKKTLTNQRKCVLSGFFANAASGLADSLW